MHRQATSGERRGQGRENKRRDPREGRRDGRRGEKHDRKECLPAPPTSSGWLTITAAELEARILAAQAAGISVYLIEVSTAAEYAHIVGLAAVKVYPIAVRLINTVTGEGQYFSLFEN